MRRLGAAIGLLFGALSTRWAIAATAALAAAHLTVLVVLVAMRTSGSDVANDSLGAMALRAATWTGIALVARGGGRTHAVR